MANPLKHFERYRDAIPDFEDFSAAVRRDSPVYLRINTLKLTVAEGLARLAALGVEARPVPWCHELFAVTTPLRLGATLMHNLGHYYLQSASSALPAVVLDPQPGETILDLCAAPGSKTTFIAQRLAGKGVVVANEPSPTRISYLSANLRRLGVVNSLVTTYAGESFPTRATFDRVLADVPCSGEGTWRGPDARPKPLNDRMRQRLAERQARILERAARVLKPGGVLVYSTCTYAPEENEEVLSEVVSSQGLTLVDAGVDVGQSPGFSSFEGKTFAPGMEKTLRLYPHRFDSEGFFVAKMVKS